jgi:histone H1/5
MAAKKQAAPKAKKTVKKKPVAKKTAKKAATKKPVAKKAAKKPAAKKPAVKKVAKKAPAKKTSAKKPAAKKPADKKMAKKPAAKKSVAKKPAKKAAAKKPAKKAVVTKPAAKAAPAKRKAAKKSTSKTSLSKSGAAADAVAKGIAARKAAAKAKSAARFVPLPNKKKGNAKKLTKAEAKTYEAMLIRIRDELSRQIAFLRGTSLTRADEVNPEEDGTDAFERQLALKLAANEGDAIFEIDEALVRIKEGVYAICEDCGCIISPARLKALPFARQCVECKSLCERSGGYSQRRFF